MEQKRQHQIPRHIQIEPSEKVILTLRQHWSVFRSAILLTFFIPFLLFSGVYFIKTTGFVDWAFFVDGLLGLAVIIFLSGLISLVVRYYFWRRTIYILTDQRVIVAVQEGPFSRNVEQAPNHKIMNVTARVEGLAANLYGYGDVSIEVLLPGRERAIVFQRVKNPHQIQHEIMKLSLSQAKIKAELSDRTNQEIVIAD